MTILTTELIESRIKELENNKSYWLTMESQARSNSHACAGAILECKRLLKLLMEPTDKENEDTAPVEEEEENE